MSTIEFTQSFDQFRNLLHTFAFRLTKNEDDAQDLVQETAFKAFKYRKMYQPHTNLRAWLMTIMRNTFINDYRRKKRRQTLNDTSSNNYFIDSGINVVRNHGESNVTIEEIKNAIDDLEDWVKIPFLLHYRGYKYEEIAQELDIPLGTVKSRIFFARKKLQQALRHIYNSASIEDLLD